MYSAVTHEAAEVYKLVWPRYFAAGRGILCDESAQYKLDLLNVHY